KLAISAKKVKEDNISERQYHDVRRLGETVIANLKQTLDAIARMDVDEAIEAIKADETVNEEFENLQRLLIIKMMEDPRVIKDALSISWSARALERIGDHTKNINEYLIYLVKGKDIRHIDLDDIEDTLDD
ncbi:MAG: phosphate transport system regulator PhoU, partial [Enterobacterales bacterium]|nr:phosphate transport system regulator PhoU [Enterobacterales bacterium]